MKQLIRFLMITGLILLLMKSYLNVDPREVGLAVLNVLSALANFFTSLFGGNHA